MKLWILGIGMVVSLSVGAAQAGQAPACCGCFNTDPNEPFLSCVLTTDQDAFGIDCEGQGAKATCTGEFPGTLEECIADLESKAERMCPGSFASTPSLTGPAAVSLALALAGFGFAALRRRRAI